MEQKKYIDTKKPKTEYEIPEGYEAKIEGNKVILVQKESEDERIMRNLIHFLELQKAHHADTSEIDECISYLERQKEQKPIFRVGDTMRTWDEAKRGIKEELPHIISINSTHYLCNNEAIRISEQGDYEFPPMNRQQPAEWSKEDKERLDSIIESYKELLRDYKACHDVDYIPYNSDTVIRNVVDDVNFLKSLRPQPKPTEDELEKKYQEGFWKGREEGYKAGQESTIFHYPTFLPCYAPGGICTNPHCDCLNCPKQHTGGSFATSSNFGTGEEAQPHWKPSEEQMQWLESAAKLSTDKPRIHGIIISIYEQLKRL